jgi:hypothetical protein
MNSMDEPSDTESQILQILKNLEMDYINATKPYLKQLELLRSLPKPIYVEKDYIHPNKNPCEPRKYFCETCKGCSSLSIYYKIYGYKEEDRFPQELYNYYVCAFKVPVENLHFLHRLCPCHTCLIKPVCSSSCDIFSKHFLKARDITIKVYP